MSSHKGRKFSKKWLTSKEMVDLLKKRGLNIKNEDLAIEHFDKYNYIDGKQYSEPFIVNDQDCYEKGVDFEDTLCCVEFENSLSQILLSPILQIEKMLGKKLCDVIISNVEDIYGHYCSRKYLSKISGRNLVEKIHQENKAIPREGFNKEKAIEYLENGAETIDAATIEPNILKDLLIRNCPNIGVEYAEEPKYMLNTIEKVKNNMMKKECFRKYFIDDINPRIPFGYLVSQCDFIVLLKILEFLIQKNMQRKLKKNLLI